jgi:hypothetical protein
MDFQLVFPDRKSSIRVEPMFNLMATFRDKVKFGIGVPNACRRTKQMRRKTHVRDSFQASFAAMFRCPWEPRIGKPADAQQRPMVLSFPWVAKRYPSSIRRSSPAYSKWGNAVIDSQTCSHIIIDQGHCGTY